LVRDAWRDHARLALSRRMRSLRLMRRPEPERLARRIAALARVLDAPLAAARRLARKLALRPTLAIKLAARRSPRTRLYPDPEYTLANALAFNSAYDWGMRRACDTS
jgi:hypothetical protein